MRLLALIMGVLGIFLIGFGLSHTEVSGQVKKVLNETSPEIKQSTERAGIRLLRFLRTQNSQAAPIEANQAGNSMMKKRYDYILNCLQSEVGACKAFDASSERDYFSDIYQTSAAEFTRYAQYLKDNSSIRTAQDEALARDLLTDSSTRVQLAGLNILSLFPPSEENLNVLSTVLSTTLSTELLESGFAVLAQYRNVPGFNREAQKLFMYQIRMGTTDTSQTASRALFQFMNPDSYLYFDEKRKELRAEAEESDSAAIKSRLTDLESVLREYEMLHQIQQGP